ncbi:MAG: hypothetical protein NVS3B17_09900 [Vulcanimicrobiaceae bacterium]
MRALVLAGGGLKAGYQAGCLQVLLDEAKLRFDYVDAASGGCFNAAMICNGMTGTQIADAWRTLDPLAILSFDVAQLLRGPWARSIGTSVGLRERVFPHFGLNFEQMRAYRGADVRFNHFNFTTKENVGLSHVRIDADYLCASVALPFWFPPVTVNRETLVDSVYHTDGNIEAVREHRPSFDEIWAIWTVARTRDYRNGFLAQHFHILEMAADGNFFPVWKKIAADATVVGHAIVQEVAMHYLFNFSRDRMAAAVELGVADARRYCVEHHVPLQTPPAPAPSRASSVSFCEKLVGDVLLDEGGRTRAVPLEFEATIETGDLDRFITDPAHVASGSGTLRIGRDSFACSGTVALFVDRLGPDGLGRQRATIEPGHKRFAYDFAFRDRAGELRRFEATKYCDCDSPAGLWADTTTAFVALSRGGNRYGAGILRNSFLRFARQLTTFRAPGSGPIASLGAIVRFNRWFAVNCLDVYFRDIIDYAPF